MVAAEVELKPNVILLLNDTQLHCKDMTVFHCPVWFTRRQPNFGRRAGWIWTAPAGKVTAARLRGLVTQFAHQNSTNFNASKAKYYTTHHSTLWQSNYAMCSDMNVRVPKCHGRSDWHRAECSVALTENQHEYTRGELWKNHITNNTILHCKAT